MWCIHTDCSINIGLLDSTNTHQEDDPPGGGALKSEKVPTAKRPRRAEAVNAVKFRGGQFCLGQKRGAVNFKLRE